MEPGETWAKSMAGCLEKPAILFAMFFDLGIKRVGRPPEALSVAQLKANPMSSAPPPPPTALPAASTVMAAMTTATVTAAGATTVMVVDTYNTQQSTKSVSGRSGGGGGGGGGSDTRTTAATATADGTVMVIAVTAMTAAAVARGGDGCGGVFWRRRAVAKGRQKIAKANWRFHPPVRHRVFDAVVKHGWPSARCHGTNNMAEKKIKITPLSNIVRGQNFLKVIKLAQSSIKKWAHICAHKGR